MESPPVILYRISRFFYSIRLKFISTIINWLNRLVFSTFIPGSAKIGKKFKAGYWGLGTVIHKDSIIGDFCTIGQNVTIGRNFGDKGVPKIGNWVYVGAGSVVFGEIEIGDNVIIGSNSLINKSIPPNCIVAGNPFKLIKEYYGNYKELDLKTTKF